MRNFIDCDLCYKHSDLTECPSCKLVVCLDSVSVSSQEQNRRW